MDRLDAMRAFVAVSDAKGFAPAARRLQISASACTRMIAGLENHLGVLLLQRTTRTTKLTDAGARYLEQCRSILSQIEEAEIALQDVRLELRGRLSISAPLLFGRLHIAPLVPRLLDEHPQLLVDLQLSDRMLGLVEDNIDIAIRIGNLADSSLIARRLGRTQRILVASPAYLSASGGQPAHPSDLSDHRLIEFQSVLPTHQWTFRNADGSAFSVDIEPRLTTNSGDAAIDHAIRDGGITAAFSYQVEQPLKAGELVKVLATFAPSPVPIQAVFPTTRLLSGKVRAFLSIVEKAASDWDFVS